MKVCLNCGKENANEYEFCTECGKPFKKRVEQQRNTITENLRFAFNLAGSNIKIFYPNLVILVSGVLFTIVFGLIFGLGAYGNLGTDSSVITGILVIFAVMVSFASLYFVIILTPFFQHVYKNAVIGEEINLRESLKYGRSMFLPYLSAFFVMFIIIGGFSSVIFAAFPFDFDNLPDTPEGYDDLSPLLIFQYMPGFLILIPFVAFYYLVSSVMAWEKVSLIPALKLTIQYVRKRFRDLLVLVGVDILAGVVLVRIPLGGLFVWVLSIVINLALIDNYLNYQTSEIAGILATGVDENV